MAFNIDNEISKLLSSLEPEETNIEKISNVTHRSLLMMSVRDAVTKMKEREEKNEEKNEENDEKNEENEMKLFHEMIRKYYLQKLDCLKELLN